jgi:hypothetical protein
LTGWKQIPAYLNISVRTAQKWERERRMPVRRLPGGRGRVAITKDSIDRWKMMRPLPTNDPTVFRFPVGQDILVEVRFLGGISTSAHIQRVIDVLTLVKTNLE